MAYIKMNDEQRLDARAVARDRRDCKIYERQWAREEAADKMIGQLASGKCYVFPVGGKYREGTRVDLIAFLIRNNYA